MSFIPKVHEIAGGRGNYMRTFSGKRFFPFDPNIEDIDIADIAHSLSNQCRWAGHSLRFMSVAEHCYWVSFFEPTSADLDQVQKDWLTSADLEHDFETYKFERLMHDGAESYLQDMIRPLKYMRVIGSEYQKLEYNMERVIAEKFNLTHPWPISVKVADEAVCELEAQTNVRDFEHNDEGAQKFLERFYELSVKRI